MAACATWRAGIGRQHGTWHDRSGPHGRQHGATAAARRATTSSASIQRPRRARELEGQAARSADIARRSRRALPAPRAVWMMVPAGSITDGTVETLLLDCSRPATRSSTAAIRTTRTPCVAPRSCARTTCLRRCGTSGGVWGLAEGYSLMIGGDEAVVESLRPIFETLARRRTRAGAASARSAPGISPRWSTTASSTA